MKILSNRTFSLHYFIIFTSCGNVFCSNAGKLQSPMAWQCKTGVCARDEMVQIIADEVKKANVDFRYSSLSW